MYSTIYLTPMLAAWPEADVGDIFELFGCKMLAGK